MRTILASGRRIIQLTKNMTIIASGKRIIIATGIPDFRQSRIQISQNVLILYDRKYEISVGFLKKIFTDTIWWIPTCDIVDMQSSFSIE
jgi:hypothetical protein